MQDESFFRLSEKVFPFCITYLNPLVYGHTLHFAPRCSFIGQCLSVIKGTSTFVERLFSAERTGMLRKFALTLLYMLSSQPATRFVLKRSAYKFVATTPTFVFEIISSKRIISFSVAKFGRNKNAFLFSLSHFSLNSFISLSKYISGE